jgi:hypothetical protein
VYTFLQAPPSVLAPQTLFTPAPPHVQPGSTQFIPQSMPPPH